MSARGRRLRTGPGNYAKSRRGKRQSVSAAAGSDSGKYKPEEEDGGKKVGGKLMHPTN